MDPGKQDLVARLTRVADRLVAATRHAAMQDWSEIDLTMPQLQQRFAQLPGGAQLLQTLLGNVKDSLVYAIQGSFLLGAVLMAVACVVNFFLKEVPLRRSFAEEVQPAPAAAEANPEGPYLITGAAIPAGREVIGAGAAGRDERAD